MCFRRKPDKRESSNSNLRLVDTPACEHSVWSLMTTLTLFVCHRNVRQRRWITHGDINNSQVTEKKPFLKTYFSTETICKMTRVITIILIFKYWPLVPDKKGNLVEAYVPISFQSVSWGVERVRSNPLFWQTHLKRYRKNAHRFVKYCLVKWLLVCSEWRVPVE